MKKVNIFVDGQLLTAKFSGDLPTAINDNNKKTLKTKLFLIITVVVSIVIMFIYGFKR